MQIMIRAVLLATFFSAFFSLQLTAQIGDEPVSVGALETDIDTSDEHDSRIPWFTHAELSERVIGLPAGCVHPQFTAAVKGYINTYAVRKREKCEGMLGRRILYFPLFEKYLRLHGMPDELKYLAVTESALNPNIVSSAGARGLWQFMPPTGKQYGLDISRYCDERCDPNKSTEAAMQYLKKLFSQFGSWELALAAYNSGEGRVSRAIKRAHSRNFWRLQPYLPAETRNYVPAFIAAMYICHYYQTHNLVPETQDLEKQLTTSTRVFETMTFSDIAEATGLKYETVQQLNPSFSHNFIPQAAKGHFVTVPTRVFPAFLKWLNGRGGSSYLTDNPVVFGRQGANTVMVNEKYMLSTWKPKSGETIETIAAANGIAVEHLKIWNNLPWGSVTVGRDLRIYQPFSITESQPLKIDGSKVAIPINRDKKPEKKTTVEVITKPAQTKKEREKEAEKRPNSSALKPADRQEIAGETAKPSAKMPAFHNLQRGESLDDVAAQYGLPKKELLSLNPKIELKIGARVKLRS